MDTARFAPSAATRGAVRAELGVGDAPLVFSAGRLVSKKGFEYLIDAVGIVAARVPGLRLADRRRQATLRETLAQRARALATASCCSARERRTTSARLAAAADVIAVPSVHDDQGNVDGLPNFALEAMATATPVVATRVGGLPQAIEDGVTGRLVPERDARALAAAIEALLRDSAAARRLGEAARTAVIRRFGWARTAERFEYAYDCAAQSRKH